jgi:lipopolysaccharide transport system ATP-binding protein
VLRWNQFQRMNAIEVSGVGKKYSLVTSPLHRLLDLMGSARKPRHGDFWALEDISFSVGVGESFGIIGSNGSGKSTLLQIVAGVMQPTRGTVTVNGRISAILELAAGFNPEFSGRDNVFMNASILGLTDEQIKQRFSAIEEFAEIGDFIDRPVKTYSSGMLMRLAFSIAVHIDPQVLIVDEALSVGDIYFTQRCLRYLHRLRERGITMLIVSHSPGELRALCSQSMWIEHGQIQEIGDTDAVVAKYLARATEVHSTSSLATASPPDGLSPGFAWIDGQGEGLRPAPAIAEPGHRYGNQAAEIIAAGLRDSAGSEKRRAKPGDEVVINVKALARKKLVRPIVGFLMRNERGETVYGLNTASEGHDLPALEAGDCYTLSFTWTAPRLVKQRYTFTIAVAEGDLTTFDVCDYVEDLLSLDFDGPDSSDAGYIQLPCRVRAEIFEESTIPIA